MKIWKGPEREGKDIGKDTIFVESSVLDFCVINKVKEIAKKEKISRIYFGAGRVDILKIEAQCLNGLNNAYLIAESSYNNLSILLSEIRFNERIARLDLNAQDKAKNIKAKIDYGDKVSFFVDSIETNLKTLKKGLYTDTDTLLYFD